MSAQKSIITGDVQLLRFDHMFFMIFALKTTFLPKPMSGCAPRALPPHLLHKPQLCTSMCSPMLVLFFSWNKLLPSAENSPKRWLAKHGRNETVTRSTVLDHLSNAASLLAALPQGMDYYIGNCCRILFSATQASMVKEGELGNKVVYNVNVATAPEKERQREKEKQRERVCVCERKRERKRERERETETERLRD